MALNLMDSIARKRVFSIIFHVRIRKGQKRRKEIGQGVEPNGEVKRRRKILRHLAREAWMEEIDM